MMRPQSLVALLAVTLACAAIAALSLTFVPVAAAASTYDAVADFSISSNPNGAWSYLYNTGTGNQLLTQTTIPLGVPGVNSWWNGSNIPDSVRTFQNTNSSP